MRIKLDENLPSILADRLKSLGHDVHTLHDEKLVGLSDDKIWLASQKESRFLITQDLDFSDLRRFIPGTHNGILLVRLRLPKRADLISRVAQLFEKQNVESWVGCFVVATDLKLRVIRPLKKS
jgi:predicted nuclease of predicted toxin-antitoxin system